MFFFRMISRALRRQLGKRVMIAVTICLGAALTTSMLAVMLDIGDKVTQELSSYGANIEVTPKGASVVSEMYGTDDEPTGALKEEELPRLKSIFWAYNLEDFAPYLKTAVRAEALTSDTGDITLLGTWFDYAMAIEVGEPVETGLMRLRDWWDVEGSWADDDDPAAAMAGASLAAARGWAVGDIVTVAGAEGEAELTIAGIFHGGGDEDDLLYATLATAQRLAGREGELDRIEVRAITTPENELPRRAERDPTSLSVADWETWYCTAYPSSIAYQIEEVIPGAVAKQVRQVAALQGNVLQKTQAVMILMTVLSLIAAAVAVANLMVASIGERSGELALLKALGATDAAVSRLMLAETAAISLLGAIVGALLGSGVAQLIGRVVFGSGITMRPMVFVLVFVLLAVTVLLASASSIRSILNLKPAEVLHGR